MHPIYGRLYLFASIGEAFEFASMFDGEVYFENFSFIYVSL